MGNSLSSWGGQKRVQKIISSSGLPLQIDNSEDEDDKRALSTFTEAYPAPGWFTGVKSAITVRKSVADVYESLSKDLQNVFTPMSECDDEIEEDDGKGKQVIFRIVRIPFKVAFVSGNLKLRLHVEQDRQTGKIHFESVKEGRLITRFIADFDIHSSPDRPDETIVKLDSKVNCKSLPPPPFKNMVKDVMVRKMDSCMVDLLEFHKIDERDESSEDEFASASGEPVQEADVQQLPAQKTGYSSFLEMVRSLSAPLRHSFDVLERRMSLERPKRLGLQDSAHEDLGHTPLAETSIPESDTASVFSQSSLYKSTSDVHETHSGDLVSGTPRTQSALQEPTQADVFAAWQNKSPACSSLSAGS